MSSPLLDVYIEDPTPKRDMPPKYEELFPNLNLVLPPSFLTLTSEDPEGILVIHSDDDEDCYSQSSNCPLILSNATSFAELRHVSEIRLKFIDGSQKFEIWNTNGEILFKGAYPSRSLAKRCFHPLRRDPIQIFDLNENNSSGIFKFEIIPANFNLLNRLSSCCALFLRRKRRGARKVLTGDGVEIGRISFQTSLWKSTVFTIERSGFLAPDGDEEKFKSRFINANSIEIWKCTNENREEEMEESLMAKVNIHEHERRDPSSNYFLMRFLKVDPTEKALFIAFLLLLKPVIRGVKRTRKVAELTHILFSILVVCGLIYLILSFAI